MGVCGSKDLTGQECTPSNPSDQLNNTNPDDTNISLDWAHRRVPIKREWNSDSTTKISRFKPVVDGSSGFTVTVVRDVREVDSMGIPRINPSWFSGSDSTLLGPSCSDLRLDPLGSDSRNKELNQLVSDSRNKDNKLFIDWGKNQFSSSTKSRPGWSARSTSRSSYSPYPITEVLPGKLYLGTMDDAGNEDALRERNITHILSVIGSKHLVEDMKHKHAPMNDYGRTDLGNVMDKVYVFMQESQETGKALFVHCQSGQNRSATVTIAFLMKSKGMTLFKAHRTVIALRPIVQINEGYAKQLLTLDRKLHGETSLPDDWMERSSANLDTGEVHYRNERMTTNEQRLFKTEQQLLSTVGSEGLRLGLFKLSNSGFQQSESFDGSTSSLLVEN